MIIKSVICRPQPVRLDDDPYKYTVSGLSTYLVSLDKLSDDGVKATQSDAAGVINRYIASDYTDIGFTADGLTFVGNYLLTTSSNKNSYVVSDGLKQFRE